MLYLIRDERYHFLAHSDVHQIVAQREVQKFALPYLLSGEVLFIILYRDVGYIHRFHAIGGILMFYAVSLPFAVDANGQRADAFQSAAVDVAEEHKAVFISNNVVLCMSNGFFKRNVAR